MSGANFNVRFGEKLHSILVSEICERQRHSERKMSDRWTKWREMDDAAVAYIKPREIDSLRKSAKKTGGLADYVQIEVPYSYGMMMSAHTYWTSVFLNRDPIYQYLGRHGEGQQSVLAVEALMQYQVQAGGQLPSHYIWLYDAAKYGVGIMGRYWDKSVSRYTEIQEQDVMFLGQPTGQKRKVKVTKEVPEYEGNRSFNVHPTKFFHDPRVTYSQLQNGEYCGYETEVAWHDILEGEHSGRYFNVKALRNKIHANQNREGSQTSERLEVPVTDDEITAPSAFKTHGFVQLLQFYIRLSPKEWGLGKGSLPEIWCFTLANKAVIIEARPLGEITNDFPFYAIESEIEGYGLFKRGVLETMQPMNDIMTWLFNSHFFNVRAALNNQLIYDPSKVVMKDILDPSPGKRIRLKPDAYGTDPRLAVTQLDVGDVTRSHINDLGSVGELMQRTLGITDNVMGLVNDGGRKTATEARQSANFGINRLKTVAEWMSANGFEQYSKAMLQTTQQFYSNDQKFRIVGDARISEPFIQVNPEMIAGNYDFVPVDGTLPVDRYAQANLWTQMLQGLYSDPAMQQQFDVAGIFTHIAQLSGLKNINQFRINVASQPLALEEEADKGNVVPLGANPAETGQIPNLGPTG